MTEQKLELAQKIIVALDTTDKETALDLSRKLYPVITKFKIGLQLFLAVGWQIVDELKSMGAEIFLDLKLHDIPSQVSSTCREIVRRGVNMFTLHTLGGLPMLEEAVKAVSGEAEKRGVKPPKLLGVTILTSLNEERLRQLGFSGTLEDIVANLVILAQKGGLDGVVTSPCEVGMVRKMVPDTFLIVAPGIKLEGIALQDQVRIMSAREAIKQGASYVVVGRAITAALDPVKQLDKILAQF
jgi:orotidine-5'-phosphate decarboxylase